VDQVELRRYVVEGKGGDGDVLFAVVARSDREALALAIAEDREGGQPRSEEYEVIVEGGLAAEEEPRVVATTSGRGEPGQADYEAYTAWAAHVAGPRLEC
jgi:hypothetical protein